MNAGFVSAPGLSYVTFESESIGAQICVGFDIDGDDEPARYQTGDVMAGIEIIEIWQNDVDWSQHLTDSTVRVIEFEVYAEHRRRANAAHQTRLDFYAPAAQFARIAAGREFV